MRSLIKLPLLALCGLAVIQSIKPDATFAGSAPVTLPDAGSSNLGDTLSPREENSSSAVTERLNNGLLNILETIRANQSVPTVDGNTLSITPEQIAAIRAALSSGQNLSGISSGAENGEIGPANGIRPGATNAGGSVFGLRNSDINRSGSTSVDQPSRGRGNVFGLRDSDINSGDIDTASTSPRRGGGNVFSLRDSSARRAVLSPEAIAAISALEQKLAAETGLTIRVDILKASPRNYIRAANAANRIIDTLSGEQLMAIAESPTFVAILAILNNADLYVGTDEETIVSELRGEEGRLGVPFMSLL